MELSILSPSLSLPLSPPPPSSLSILVSFALEASPRFALSLTPARIRGASISRGVSSAPRPRSIRYSSTAVDRRRGAQPRETTGGETSATARRERERERELSTNQKSSWYSSRSPRVANVARRSVAMATQTSPSAQPYKPAKKNKKRTRNSRGKGGLQLLSRCLTLLRVRGDGGFSLSLSLFLSFSVCISLLSRACPLAEEAKTEDGRWREIDARKKMKIKRRNWEGKIYKRL